MTAADQILSDIEDIRRQVGDRPDLRIWVLPKQLEPILELAEHALSNVRGETGLREET
jgi:hypothetical protein